MPKLLKIASAPVIEKDSGKLVLDVKFVEGMRLHVEQWGGPVTCLLKRGATDIPFGRAYDPADLGFDLEVIPPDIPIAVDGLTGGDLILAAADMHDVLHLAAPDYRPPGVKLVYAIEYDLNTRMQIASLDKNRSFLRKARTKFWLLKQERRRRSALRNCDGIQANGYPAFAAYSPLNKQSMMYLDGRMEEAAMVTSDEQAARAAYLRSGAPLRIVHSGRLETMKGGQDLIPVAKALQETGINFTLDIFGTGSLYAEIRASIAAAGLGNVVHMHGPVSFAADLVPFFRQSADVFLSCHRQSDPSCTYLESMGCGIPIVGYQNSMWRALAESSGGGWAVPLGKVEAISNCIAKLNEDRELLIEAGKQGARFAKGHSFETELSKRMTHLRGFVT